MEVVLCRVASLTTSLHPLHPPHLAFLKCTLAPIHSSNTTTAIVECLFCYEDAENLSDARQQQTGPFLFRKADQRFCEDHDWPGPPKPSKGPTPPTKPNKPRVRQCKKKNWNVGCRKQVKSCQDNNVVATLSILGVKPSSAQEKENVGMGCNSWGGGKW